MKKIYHTSFETSRAFATKLGSLECTNKTGCSNLEQRSTTDSLRLFG